MPPKVQLLEPPLGIEICTFRKYKKSTIKKYKFATPHTKNVLFESPKKVQIKSTKIKYKKCTFWGPKKVQSKTQNKSQNLPRPRLPLPCPPPNISLIESDSFPNPSLSIPYRVVSLPYPFPIQSLSNRIPSLSLPYPFLQGAPQEGACADWWTFQGWKV